jgi:peptidoglycan/xylan/chitin deacetylase (PgdA/CDA1 family)
MLSGSTAQELINLTFHGIGDPERSIDRDEADFWITRERFESILDPIAERGDVHITFDDGNASDLEQALPVLRASGLQATFFICAGRLGTPGFLDQGDVRELRSAGMSIGSHGMDHVPWRKLNQAGIEREIVRPKLALEEALEEPVDVASCPFGAYDRRTLSALRDAGFRRVYASDGGPARPGDWLVPRNTVRRWDSDESVDRMLRGLDDGVTLAQRTKRWVKQWR